MKMLSALWSPLKFGRSALSEHEISAGCSLPSVFFTPSEALLLASLCIRYSISPLQTCKVRIGTLTSGYVGEPPQRLTPPATA